MKQLLFLVTLAVAITVLIADRASCREYPYYELNQEHVGGEDHPWGGDQGDPVDPDDKKPVKSATSRPGLIRSWYHNVTSAHFATRFWAARTVTTISGSSFASATVSAASPSATRNRKEGR